MTKSKKLKQQTDTRSNHFRFGLLSMVMVLSATSLAIEKPIRKYQGIAAIDRIYTKNVGPSEIDWRPTEPSVFPPLDWVDQRLFPREIETVRLIWRLPEEFYVSTPDELKPHEQQALNQLTLIKILKRYPEATENIKTFSCSHPLDPKLENYIATRYQLRVLELTRPPSTRLVKSLKGLTQLEVLYLPGKELTEEEIELLSELNWLQWLRVSQCPPDKLSRLRDKLPNTYVD